MTFVPVEVTTQTGGKETAGPAHKLTIDHAVPARTQDPPPKPSRKPLREAKVPAPRGVIEISLRNGARVSVDADVNEAALRLVLSAMKEL